MSDDLSYADVRVAWDEMKIPLGSACNYLHTARRTLKKRRTRER
jgi:hypothetical protein